MKKSQALRYWITDNGSLVDTVLNTSWLGRLVRPATVDEIQKYLLTPVSTTGAINVISVKPQLKSGFNNGGQIPAYGNEKPEPKE